MKANILCPNCKKTILDVELIGPHAEFETQCPLCGPISGVVLFSFRDFGAEAGDGIADSSDLRH